MGEREWYLYSLRDRKYPSGLRTNRATETGYWKATGKDRQVYASGITSTAAAAGGGGGGGGVLIGMKKTLVFYQGRAPRGLKTRWVMHEYRLDGHFSSFRLSSKEEWVICRVFHKNGEKKLSSSPIIHPPPPPSPPPLSPFLSSLPPLQDPTPSSRPHYGNNHDLLQSLLLNPLPNFSSISGSDTIFPPLLQTTTTTTAVASSTLFKPFVTAAVTKECQNQQQHWLDKICPQFHHHHNHDHHPLNYDNQMDCIGPNSGDDDGVHHVVEMSGSIGVNNVDDALDRMLNHTINHPSESWTFHP